MKNIFMLISASFSYLVIAAEQPTPVTDAVLQQIYPLYLALPKGRQTKDELVKQRPYVIETLKELEKKIPALDSELTKIFKGTKFKDSMASIPDAIRDLRKYYESESEDLSFGLSAASNLRLPMESIFFDSNSIAATLSRQKVWSAEKYSSVSSGTFFKTPIENYLALLKKEIFESDIPKAKRDTLQKTIRSLERELVQQNCLPDEAQAIGTSPSSH